MKKHYEQYTSDDFVNDESFVDWVVNPDKEDVSFWQKFCTKYPEQELAIKKAIRFIHSMKAQESDIDSRRFEVMWQNILSQQKNKQHKIRIRRWLSAVAAVFVLAIATYAYFSINKPLIIDSEELAVVDTESIHVVLGDGSVKTLLGENSKISQESDGTLVVNSDTIKSIQDQTIKVAMNKLVVPYGKRTDLYLSDGTHIYVNSGSKLEFPSVFKGNKREIFLEGEAFCEVVADQEHPFIIHTPDIDVRVTGTVFNVQAYRNEEHSHTVLVKGQVTLINQRGLLKDKMIVRPGEKVLFNKETGDFSAEKVNTEQYTSWIHGYMVLDKRSVSYVFRSLERYYDTEIKYKDITDDVTFSGKLDLKENIADVLSIIGFASSLDIINEAGVYCVQKQ